MTAQENVASVAAELGLTMTSVFVPFSRSRNAGEKQPSLNWIVTIKRNGRDVLATDYMSGCGHCPSYKQFDSNACRAMAVSAECETGFAHRISSMHPVRIFPTVHILPTMADVLASLASDGIAIDHGTFEEWASEFGYDVDSRKAEATYRACLEIGLKLRSALGESGFAKLRDACTDY